MKIILCSFNPDISEKWHSILTTTYTDIEQCKRNKTLSDFASELSSTNDYIILFHLKNDANDEKALYTFIKQFPIAKHLLVLVNTPNADQGIRLLHAGIHGYANAHLNETKLLTAINVIAEGEIWAGEDILIKLLQKKTDISTQYRRDVELNQLLSNREKEIVDQIVKGKTNKQIANELYITERTVKAHLSAIFKKTKTRNRFELMMSLQRINSA